MVVLASIALTVLTIVAFGLVLERLSFRRELEAQPGDDPLVTALRGIAAFTVLLAHLLAPTPNIVMQHFFASFGVVIFFLLTGHLFYGMVLDDRLDLRTFMKKRVRRVVPAAFVAVALIQTLDWIENGMHAPTGAQLFAIARNFSFGFQGDMFGVSAVWQLPSIVRKMGMIWTLRFEWLFYLSLPLAAYVCGKSILRVGLATAALAVIFSSFEPAWDIDNCHFIAFGFGAFSAWSLRKWPPASTKTAIFGVFVGLLLMFGIYLPRIPHDAIASGRASFIVLTAIVFTFMLRLSGSKAPLVRFVLRLRGLQALGAISYSLYLYHMLVIYYVLTAAERWLGPHARDLNGYAAAALAAIPIVAGTLFLSTLSYLRTERPFIVRLPTQSAPNAPAAALVRS